MWTALLIITTWKQVVFFELQGDARQRRHRFASQLRRSSTAAGNSLFSSNAQRMEVSTVIATIALKFSSVVRSQRKQQYVFRSVGAHG